MTTIPSLPNWQLLSTVGKWDGSLAIPPDVNADLALREGLSLMEALLSRKDSPCRVTPAGGRRRSVEDFAKRLKSLLGVSMEAVIGQLECNTLHPHVALLLKHFWHHDLGQAVRNGNWKSLIPHLQKLRQLAMSDEILEKVKVFEELSRRRLEKNQKFTRKVLRNRHLMKVVWLQVAIPRQPFSPPDTNALQLNAALSRLTKKSEQWRTRVTFHLELGHREQMRGYFADLVLFFSADEGRSGEELADMVGSEWGDITCGKGLCRHVATIARSYLDGFTVDESKRLLTEEELQAQVTSLLAMFAERTRYLRLSGIGKTHRSAPVKVLRHADRDLPQDVSDLRGSWAPTHLAKPAAPNFGGRQFDTPTDPNAERPETP